MRSRCMKCAFLQEKDSGFSDSSTGFIIGSGDVAKRYPYYHCSVFKEMLDLDEDKEAIPTGRCWEKGPHNGPHTGSMALQMLANVPVDSDLRLVPSKSATETIYNNGRTALVIPKQGIIVRHEIILRGKYANLLRREGWR